MHHGRAAAARGSSRAGAASASGGDRWKEYRKEKEYYKEREKREKEFYKERAKRGYYGRGYGYDYDD